MPGNDQYTVLLIHSDTTDGSTVFEDSSAAGNGGENHAISAVYMEHSADQQQFGATSIHGGSSSRLVVADHADFQLGSDDWTMDAWIYPLSITSYGHRVAHRLDSFTGSIDWQFASPGDGTIYFSCYDEAGGAHSAQAATRAVVQGVWQHVAAERFGADINVYVGGNLVATVEIGEGVAIRNQNIYMVVNGGYRRESDGAWVYGPHGHMDEFRFSKGVARYQGAGFTPPTAPYDGSLPSAGPGGNDGDCVLLLDCDGEDGGTEFEDSSYAGRGGEGHAVSPYAVTTSTDEAVEGFGQNGRFDPAGAVTVPRIYVTHNYEGADDFSFRAGDFTLDLRARPDDAGDDIELMNQWGSVGKRSWRWQLLGDGGGMARLRFIWTTDGTTEQSATSGSFAWDADWHHLAVERAAGVLRFFAAGAVVGSVSCGAYLYPSTWGLQVGALAEDPSTHTGAVAMRLDEIRVSKRARFQGANFTPNTAAYTIPPEATEDLGLRLAAWAQAYEDLRLRLAASDGYVLEDLRLWLLATDGTAREDLALRLAAVGVGTDDLGLLLAASDGTGLVDLPLLLSAVAGALEDLRLRLAAGQVGMDDLGLLLGAGLGGLTDLGLLLLASDGTGVSDLRLLLGAATAVPDGVLGGWSPDGWPVGGSWYFQRKPAVS